MSVTDENQVRGDAPALAPRIVHRRPWWRRRLTIVAAVLLALLMPVAWSVGHALTAPGNDSIAARLAEWGRDHHAGALVTWLERLSYHPPKVGGRPAADSPLTLATPVPTATYRVRARSGPARVIPPASPPLPGEGSWHPLVVVHGRPAVEAAYLRPDALHTSYTAAAVWIDPRRIRAVFHPGLEQPGGGPWPVPPDLQGAQRRGLVAAFNSAFRLQDSRGGFVGYGRTVAPLVTGAASLVIYRDGRMNVGAWGRDVRMTPDVAVVRQNLVLVVDHGRAVDGLASNAGGKWGYTLGNADYVWRSGIGVTARGDLVFVSGDRLSAVTLADLLRRAGAVRAMELDINPYWTSFILYRSATGSTIERNLLPDMERLPTRYDTQSTRDFVALYAR